MKITLTSMDIHPLALPTLSGLHLCIAAEKDDALQLLGAKMPLHPASEVVVGY
jgi:hypothetical protein